jgi:hypothetical protein
LGVLALLACTLYRLDPYRRRIAIAPISIAALMLASHLASPGLPVAFPTVSRSPQPVAAWLPLFLAVCIFYMPEAANFTNNFFMALSGLILVSGLLPGDGPQAIFATAQVFLFMGLVVCLAVDFSRQPVKASATS